MKVLRRARRGTTAVEFAVVAPLVFLLLFSSIEIARVQIMRHAIENAAYEGARHGITPGATAAETAAEAVSYMARVSARDVEVTVTPDVITDETSEVTVEVSVPLDSNCWITPRFSPGYVLSASSTLLTERYRQ